MDTPSVTTPRVLHLDPETGWRGGQNQVYLLAKGMANRHWDVFVATPNDSALCLRLENELTLCRLPSPARPFSLKLLLTLWRFCSKHRIDIIDCHSSRAHTIALLLRLLRPKLKIVVHRRVDFKPSNNAFGRFKYKSKWVTRFVGISEAISNILDEFGIEAERIKTVKSAVDDGVFRGMDYATSRQRIAEELKIPNDSVWILCPAAFTHQKDHLTLVRAIDVLSEQSSRFQILLAGDGPLQDEIKAFVSEHGLESHVHFLGFRKDVPVLLKACDILTLSSRLEGLGTSILDGIHGECAIVATRVGGIPEMVTHQSTGWLAPRESPMELSICLLEAINDREKRLRFARDAKANLPVEFTVDHMVIENMKIYQEIVAT